MRDEFQAQQRDDSYADGYSEGFLDGSNSTRDFIYKRLLMKGFTEKEARDISGKI